MSPEVEYSFGGERIVLNIEGNEARVVYLTIKGDM